MARRASGDRNVGGLTKLRSWLKTLKLIMTAVFNVRLSLHGWRPTHLLRSGVVHSSCTLHTLYLEPAPPLQRRRQHYIRLQPCLLLQFNYGVYAFKSHIIVNIVDKLQLSRKLHRTGNVHLSACFWPYDVTQNLEVDFISVSRPSELALEEICRSEGDDTDDMDTDTVSWSAATADRVRTWGTVYWLLIGYFGLRRGQNRDSVFCQTLLRWSGCWREIKD